jgi:hypothetical protein
MPIGNGGIIGVANDPTSSVASGVWSLQEQELAKKAGAWPNSDPTLALDFDETTTLDSRITFTRATNGTYFDSSGVLQTASSGVARFDHRLEGGVWVNKGLLIEVQRTNICLQSENFATTWSTGAPATVTVTTNSTDAPDGTTTADLILETTQNSQHFVNQSLGTLNATSTAYTVSYFVKAAGRNRGYMLFFTGADFAGLSLEYNLSTLSISASTFDNGETLIGSSITDVGDGWYRVSISGIVGQNASYFLRIYTQNDTDDAFDAYVGDVTKGAYLWGAQVEAGAFPTSYIKTTSASVTRNADVVSMTGTNFSDWYNQTEGTVFWQGDFTGVTTASARAFAFSNNTSNERIICIARSDFFRATGIDGGVTQFEIDASGVVTGQTYEAALALKLNDIAFAVDGSLIGTDTSATLPTPDRVYLGSNFNGGETLFNGHAAKFYYWNTRKSNSFLQNITS